MTRADIVEQIRRDVEALKDPWLVSEWWRAFYTDRIEKYRAVARELEATESK